MALFLAFGAALFLRERPVRNAATGCLTEGAAGQHIIIVDRTDRWTPSAGELIGAKIDAIAAALPDDHRLTLLAFNGDASVLAVPAFDGCKPRRSGNALYETPQRLARSYTERFAAPLATAIAATIEPAKARKTELVAFLGALGARATVSGMKPIHMHVFSDMDEHASAFAFAKGHSAQAFAAHFSAQAGDRLQALTLHVHQLPLTRSPRGAGAEAGLSRPWTEAFARHGITFSWEVL